MYIFRLFKLTVQPDGVLLSTDYVFISTTGRMPDKSNGDIAADGYHKYKVKKLTNSLLIAAVRS